MAQAHRGQRVGRSDARGHAHRLARGRDRRAVNDTIDLRRRLGLISGVALARRAEVLRDLDQETAGDALVPRPRDQPRVAPNPARAEIDGQVVVAPDVGCHVDLHPVGPVVAVTVGDQVQFAAIHVRRPMVALCQPSV